MEELRSSVDAVGEDVAQFGEHSSDEPQQRHGAMIVLNVGGLNKHGEQRAFGIGDDVTLAAFDFLATSNPRGPPLSVVFALWLSMMPADGIGLRPMVWRASLTRLRLMQCQVPSSRQR